MLNAGLQPLLQYTQLSLHILDCLLSQSVGLRVIGGRVHGDGVLLALTDNSLLKFILVLPVVCKDLRTLSTM